jgi:hypothetical protein
VPIFIVDLRKIGEGSYADVYRVERNGEEIVIKIVPVNGFATQKDPTTGDLIHDPQTSFEDILSESLISVELTKVLLNENAERFYAPVFARTHFIKVNNHYVFCLYESSM